MGSILSRNEPSDEPGTIQVRFDAFRAFFDDAIQTARDFRAFRLAARRYLCGIDIAGPHPLSADDHEDAILQYVFALEALLAGGDRESIGDKLATRAAWLIGTSDTVRTSVYRAVKKLYGERSSIVHGSSGDNTKQSSRVLDEVRDLLRRVLMGLIKVGRRRDLDAKNLRVSQALQRVGGETRFVEPKSDRSRRMVPLPDVAVDALRRQRAAPRTGY